MKPDRLTLNIYRHINRMYKMLDNTSENVFIYDGKEVTLTGRIAKKHIYHRRDTNKVIGQMAIVEIVPKISSSFTLSTDMNLAQWVNPRDLFYVILDEKIDDTDVDSIIELNKEAEELNE